MMDEPATLDEMFHALSDRSRRGMVDRLGRGPASVSELAEPLSMALPTVMKHLAVLERSGLVHSEKSGRVRTYRLEAGALGQVERWLAGHKASWNASFDRLERFLSDDQPE
ncbi:metalloregulator ArsR/SmtB family transcription factor [Rhizobium sp. IBUN]|uniref:ArsR/SmtB family transcription factor n=1 Tax=Rhizobium sp. IBUN TaxID=1042326 RepID=UPI00041DDC39|nr:metalloregulator ArsR/SmtB family transcription factor [Rhizobium sp. IBUN]